MGNFFISYQHDSEEFALILRDQIEEAGFLGWIATRLRAGEAWKISIDNAIKDSLGVIVVVTPKALQSQYVTYEWSFALGLGKPLIPVILEFPDPNNPNHPDIHPKLVDIHQRDFSDSTNRPWQILFDDLEAIENQNEIPDPVQNALLTLRTSHKPDEWTTAIDLLEKYPHFQAREALATSVHNPMSDIGILSALALARKTDYEDERAISGLEIALTQSKHQKQSANALANINGLKAVDCLINALNNPQLDSTMRMIFLKALSRTKHPHAIPYLKSLLFDNEGEIGEVAALALGEIKNASVLPELFEVLEKHDWWRTKRAAAKAIGDIADSSSVEPLVKILEPYYYTAAQGEIEIAQVVIQSLGQIGDELALSHLRSFLNELRFANLHRDISQIIENIEKQ